VKHRRRRRRSCFPGSLPWLPSLFACELGDRFVTDFSSHTENGIPVKTTLDNSTTVQYAALIHQLVMKARSTVRDIDPQNDLTFLRVRSKKNEIMIAPDKDYFLIVIQNPSD
uniref:Dynein, light chain, roadblock-type 1 n=1 Tax=Mastacembelus armatus TaxID=205130 RepID=A0A3Q3LZ71_9TELE